MFASDELSSSPLVAIIFFSVHTNKYRVAAQAPPQKKGGGGGHNPPWHINVCPGQSSIRRCHSSQYKPACPKRVPPTASRKKFVQQADALRAGAHGCGLARSFPSHDSLPWLNRVCESSSLCSACWLHRYLNHKKRLELEWVAILLGVQTDQSTSFFERLFWASLGPSRDMIIALRTSGPASIRGNREVTALGRLPRPVSVGDIASKQTRPDDRVAPADDHP